MMAYPAVNLRPSHARRVLLSALLLMAADAADLFEAGKATEVIPVPEQAAALREGRRSGPRVTPG